MRYWKEQMKLAVPILIVFALFALANKCSAQVRDITPDELTGGVVFTPGGMVRPRGIDLKAASMPNPEAANSTALAFINKIYRYYGTTGAGDCFRALSPQDQDTIPSVCLPDPVTFSGNTVTFIFSGHSQSTLAGHPNYEDLVAWFGKSASGCMLIMDLIRYDTIDPTVNGQRYVNVTNAACP